MKAYAFLIEVGFERIPVIVIRQILQKSEEFEELLEPTWKHISDVLTFNLVDNTILLYKNNLGTSGTLCELKVKPYFVKEVEKTNAILIEVQSEVLDFDKNILEKVYLHVIINKNSKPEKIEFIKKPIFNIKGVSHA